MLDPDFKKDNLTASEIILIFRRLEIKSVSSILKNKKRLPRISTIKEIFGSLRKAVVASFSNQERSRVSKEYLIQCGMMYDIKTQADFISAHKSFPDVVPDHKCLYDHYKFFKDYVFDIKKRNPWYGINEILEMRKNKVQVTVRSCEKRGIDLKRIIELLGGKKEFNDFMKFLTSAKNPVVLDNSVSEIYDERRKRS